MSNEPLSAILTQLVGRALEQEQPENVDPAGTTLTGEGPEVEIVIVPHRDLGGISLVAWTDQYDARLLWANVGDLSTHDDLDLGVVVARIRYEDDGVGGSAKLWPRSWCGPSTCGVDGGCLARRESNVG